MVNGLCWRDDYAGGRTGGGVGRDDDTVAEPM